jgi:hypothetical protein
MPAGAVHPNTGNFSRIPRLSVVDRVRKLVAQNAYEKRPEWLQFVERAPPMELWNLKLRDIKLKSPYPAMVRYILDRFPDMRFQDCFVDGNDWSKGNDRYRDDHPAMQFAARQLQLMNTEGLSRIEAFEKTKEEYLARRAELEKRQKIEMALSQNQRIVPAFGRDSHVGPLYTTGAAVARQREAELEVAHINHIRRKLRMLRKQIEPHNKRRMSAKEVALDVEAERTSLLPRMPVSPGPVTDTDVLGEQESVSEEDDEEETFEFLTPSDDKDLPVWETFDPSVRDRQIKPIDVSGDESMTSVHDWRPDEAPARSILKPASTDRRPAMSVLKSSKPVFTQSRPDKQTVQAILNKKKKEELQRRIGKEPGDDDSLDFEDFMNMVRNKKT